MKNTLGTSLIVFLLIATSSLVGQSESPWSIGLQVGIANYVTASDFNERLYTIEGRAFNRGTGNIVEPNLSPFLGLELSLKVSERWSFTSFSQFQRYSGTLYEDDLIVFGVSSTLTEPVEFRAPADNSLTVFHLGLQAHYRIVNGENIRGYLGGGLSYLFRSHNYRNRLEVDFSETRMANSISEIYTTAEKSALAIPLSARLEKDINRSFFLSLIGQITVFPNLEDRQILGGIGLHYRL